MFIYLVVNKIGLYFNFLDMDYYEIFSVISLPLGVIILLILICRSLVLWYFRIPDMISRQDDLIREIKIQNDLLRKTLKPREEESDHISENADIVPEEQEKKPSFTELRYGKG
jgi:hypothetical protein